MAAWGPEDGGLRGWWRPRSLDHRPGHSSGLSQGPSEPLRPGRGGWVGCPAPARPVWGGERMKDTDSGRERGKGSTVWSDRHMQVSQRPCTRTQSKGRGLSSAAASPRGSPWRRGDPGRQPEARRPAVGAGCGQDEVEGSPLYTPGSCVGRPCNHTPVSQCLDGVGHPGDIKCPLLWGVRLEFSAAQDSAQGVRG